MPPPVLEASLPARTRPGTVSRSRGANRLDERVDRLDLAAVEAVLETRDPRLAGVFVGGADALDHERDRGLRGDVPELAPDGLALLGRLDGRLELGAIRAPDLDADVTVDVVRRL